MKRFASIALSSVFAFAACADEKTTPETGFEIQVAPLELPGIFDACYGITVDNGTETVWSQAGVCASQYGDGIGSITYIGTCDADGGTPDNPVNNTVSLVLEALLVADENGTDGEVDDPATVFDETETDTLVHPGDFFNPCPDGTPCQLTRPCIENQDTLVEFNITVMRAARQGFFDIAVNFSDIFCSAKFDCAYPGEGDNGDQPIELLFTADGKRADTAVLGFACTSGEETALEAGETYLYMDDIRIECTDENGTVTSYDLETSAEANGPGNQYDPAVEGQVVFQYAIYQGAEFVEEDFRKYYWNVAIGFDMNAMAGLDCNLTTKATASDEHEDGGQGLPFNEVANETIPGTTYPYLVWEINLNEGGGDRLSCGQNAPTTRPFATSFFATSGLFVEYTELPDGTVEFDNCGTGDETTFETYDGSCTSQSLE